MGVAGLFTHCGGLDYAGGERNIQSPQNLAQSTLLVSMASFGGYNLSACVEWVRFKIFLLWSAVYGLFMGLLGIQSDDGRTATCDNGFRAFEGWLYRLNPESHAGCVKIKCLLENIEE